MQISSLIPILMKILGGSEHRKESLATTRQADAETGPASTRLTSAANVPAVVDSVTSGKPGEHQAPTVQNLPPILPLPLTSPLFEESRFYIKEEAKGQSSGGKVDESTSIFACIRSKNLGLLWIALVFGKDSLAVTFYTEQDPCTKVIRESLPELERSLWDMGYGLSHAVAITRPGIRSCADISCIPAGRHYILDMEV